MSRKHNLHIPRVRARVGQIESNWREIQRWADDLAPEECHYVGGDGEPAFQNSWVNFGGSSLVACFWLDPFGYVHIAGSVKDGTPSSTSVIFTLPDGYRPEATVSFPVLGDSATSTVVPAQVNVTSAGDVIAREYRATDAAGAAPSGASSFWTLDGIVFRAVDPA